MESFVAFLRDNWKFLVEISIPLVSLIVLCFVKKTKITLNPSIWSDMLIALPDIVRQAESMYGSGEGQEKLKYALKAAIDFLAVRLGVDEKFILRSYGGQVVDAIESILATPQKKGDQ